MSTFKIDTDNAGKNVSAIDNIAENVFSQATGLREVYNTIDLGTSTEAIKQSISIQISNVETEKRKIAQLSLILGQIITEYKAAEDAILANMGELDLPEPSSGPAFENPSGDITYPEPEEPEDPDNLYKNIAEKLGLTESQVETLMFILGLIPGVNILVDCMDFVNDFQKYIADDKLTIGEATALVADLVFLAMDVVSVAKLAASIVEGARKVKKAETAAKKATDAAQELAEKAEKDAKKAHDAKKTAEATKVNKNATEAKKIGRSEKDVRAADKGYKKATKNAKEAEKTARKSEKAAKNAKNQADAANKEADKAKDAYEKAKKDAHKDGYDYGEDAIKNKVKSEGKDWISEQGEDHYWDMKENKLVWE